MKQQYPQSMPVQVLFLRERQSQYLRSRGRGAAAACSHGYVIILREHLCSKYYIVTKAFYRKCFFNVSYNSPPIKLFSTSDVEDTSYIPP